LRNIDRLLLIAAFVLFALPAYAYLDVGSGSLLAQSVLAVIAGGVVATRLWWHKIMARMRGFGTKGRKHDPHR
jgi:hypothetical protein